MRDARSVIAWAAASTLVAGALLAGCPLPQPLPDYPEGQPVTPPRIIVDDGSRRATPPETVIRVPAGCAVPPVVDLGASLRDANTIENVVARWFVNYDPANQSAAGPLRQDDILRPDEGVPDPTLRNVPVFSFRPYDHAPASGTGAGDPAGVGALHVVELVVSNGFDPAADNVNPPLPPLPFRTPLSTPQRFEVQLYRWVFIGVPASGDVECPAAAP
jgi:hypothetical protein